MEIELYGSLFLFAFLASFGKHPSRIFVYIATLIIVFMLSMHWINAFVFGAILCDVFVNLPAIAFSRQIASALQKAVVVR